MPVDKSYLLDMNKKLEATFQEYHASSNLFTRYIIRSELTQLKVTIYALKEEYARFGVDFPDLDKYPPHEFTSHKPLIPK